MSINKKINKEIIPKKIITSDGMVLNLKRQNKNKPSKLKTEIVNNTPVDISEITTIPIIYRTENIPLENALTPLLEKLSTWQKRINNLPPEKRNGKKRYGLNECEKWLKRMKISVFILACDIKYTNTNTEESPDYLVNKLIYLAKEQKITFIYGISRRKLSNAIGLFKRASCIGILDPSGIFPELKQIPIDYPPPQIIATSTPPSSPPLEINQSIPTTPFISNFNSLPASDSSINTTEEIKEIIMKKPLNINAKEFHPP